jgi:hypothetical protein
MKSGFKRDLLNGHLKHSDDPTLIQAATEIEIGRMYFATSTDHSSFSCIFVEKDKRFVVDPNMSLYPKANRITTIEEIRKYTQSVIDLHFTEEVQVFSPNNKIWFLEPYQPFMAISKDKTTLEILTEDFTGYFKYTGYMSDEVAIVEYNDISAAIVKQYKKLYKL